MPHEQRTGWIRFLAWMEIVAGGVGLLVYVWSLTRYPNAFPIWHNMLAVLFFGANIVAGYLLLQHHSLGFKASLVLQALQVLVVNLGTKIVFHAGLDLTLVIASTGVAIYAGANSAIALFPSTVGGLAASGLGYDLTMGILPRPLQEASWTIGVNFVALFFTVRLWRALDLPASETLPRPVSRPVVTAVTSVVGVIALWILLDGPHWAGTNYAGQQWPLATGDTVEIVKYTREYSVTSGGGISVDRYIWVQFRSGQDTARDHADAVAVAGLVCRLADSLGYHSVLVEPVKQSGIITTGIRHWFTSDSTGHCQETRTS